MKQLLSLLLIFYGVNLATQANANMDPNEIVAALDDDLVAIATGFSGSKILLFGSISGKGDVIITVRGPSNREVVRKKGRMMGIWANKEQVAFSNTPAFFKIASTGDVDTIVNEETKARLELGAQHLKPYLAPSHINVGDEKKEAFWQALIRSKQRDGLYDAAASNVVLLGKRLFRADIEFPANVPVGTYLVYIYLVQDQEVVHSQITPIIVSKIGMEARIYDFAQRHSLAYGVIAVLIALIAGWLASVFFRK